MDKNYVAGPPTGWRHPKKYKPPKGKKIQILSPGRISTVGIWYEGARAWAPLLEVDDELKEILDEEDRQYEREFEAKKKVFYESRRSEDQVDPGSIGEEPISADQANYVRTQCISGNAAGMDKGGVDTRV